jgi:hypothetical protein
MREGLFLSKDSIPDQVAILALYMPLIRQRIKSWVELWNIHTIRKQKNRPDAITGVPYMNYFHPRPTSQDREAIQDRKCVLDTESELIQRLQQDVQEWDPDQYLPPSTLSWCQAQLQEVGIELVGTPFDPEEPLLRLLGDPQQPYRAVYERLRTRAYAYWNSGQEPVLALCEKPVGASNWSPRREDV